MKNKLTRGICLGLCFCMLVSQAAFAAETTPDTSEPQSIEETVLESSLAPESESQSTSESQSQNDLQTETKDSPESQPQSESQTQTESQSESESQPAQIPQSESETIAESEDPAEVDNNGINTLSVEDDMQAMIDSDPTAAFVARLYTTIFNRDPDMTGMTTWTQELKSGKKNGADILVSFVYSDEFTKKNVSDEEYIDILYRAIFDREADTEGKQNWLDTLNQGLSRWYVLSGFTGSTEFWKLCDKFGIQTGVVPLSSVTDTNPTITKFVTRLYRLIFNRAADSEGLNTWVSELASHRKTAAEVICGFVYSEEFTKRNFNDSDYIEILYNTLLDRPSDASGKQDWLDTLNVGVSRDYILYNFVASTEFAKLCESYGITTGSINLSENRDKNYKMTVYVATVYQNSLGRKATTSELNDWTGKLNSHSVLASEFLYNLMFSQEAGNRTKSNEDFAKVLFQTVLLRELTGSGITEWTNKVAKSRTDAFNEITTSQEFQQLCSNYGLEYTHSDGWSDVGGTIYYYKNGQKVSGWQRIDGKLYYFNPSAGNKQVKGWNYIDGYKYYFDNKGILVQNVDSIIGKQSRYYVRVNTATNTVTIFAQDGANGFIIPVKNMICSCGAASTPTVKGTFTISRLGYWAELMGPVWGQYVSRIYGGYLFHSAWYYVNGNKRTLSVSEYRKLGTNASHGCVRLTVADAKWIFDNCNGSTVNVFSSSSQLTKFDKPTRPEPVVISGDYGYDPTDPSFN